MIMSWSWSRRPGVLIVATVTMMTSVCGNLLPEGILAHSKASSCVCMYLCVMHARIMTYLRYSIGAVIFCMYSLLPVVVCLTTTPGFVEVVNVPVP